MKFNDLSNRASPTIVFNIDNLLFKDAPKNKGFSNLISQFLVPDNALYNYLNRETNQNFVYICNSIYMNYEFSIFLQTSLPETSYEALSAFLNEDLMLYYSSLIHAQDMATLRRRLDLEYYMYVTNDYAEVREINKGNAIHFTDITQYIKKLGRRK